MRPPLPERFLGETEVMPDYLPPQGTPLPRMALMMLRFSPYLALTANLGSPAGRRRLADFYHQQGKSLIPVAPPVPGPPLEPRPTPARYPGKRVGINLIGFARSEFGLGEDIRMTSAALDAAGIEHVVIDMADASPSVARREDHRLDPRLAERAIHPISVFCMSPFDAATLWLRRGNDLFDGRYLVGYWVWELPELPKIWHEAALLVDEIWAPSRFVANALAAQSFRPVRHLPALVEFEPVPRLARRKLGLPDGTFLFICPFDPNSSPKRKNPAGAVRAFRRAFPKKRKGEDEVGLVLRVNGKTGGRGWDEVEAAIGDDKRILVIEGTMARERALAMLAASDCLVSLHRAEGYGRNIAEAKLLGTRVIATGFSGCMDFLAPEECVDFSVAPVGDDYPFGRGQIWAEPDIDQAVEKMRAAFASSRADKRSWQVGT